MQVSGRMSLHGVLASPLVSDTSGLHALQPLRPAAPASEPFALFAVLPVCASVRHRVGWFNLGVLVDVLGLVVAGL